MDFSAKHMEYVVACYAISALMLAVLTASIILRSKKHDRQLAKLELARKQAKNKR